MDTTQDKPLVKIGDVFVIELSGDEIPIEITSFNLRGKPDKLVGSLGIKRFKPDDDEPDDGQAELGIG